MEEEMRLSLLDTKKTRNYKKMNTKRFVVFTTVLGLIFFSCNRSEVQKHDLIEKKNETSYFIPIPLTKFSSTQAPCFDVAIDDQTFSMLLDLGFQGDLAIENNLIDQIPSKTFLYTKTMHGIQGKEYATDLYRVPKIKMGAMAFIDPILQKNNEEFSKDSVFVQNGQKPSEQEPGSLGWELFYNTNLLIDIKNSKIAFCDSLDTLKNQNYETEYFAKTELFIERGLIEFEAQTANGPLKCTLDTGSTLNMINSNNDLSFDQMVWNSDNIREVSSFKINNKDFGTITFHQVPIKIPIKVDAILGMEFFHDHLVFINFSEKQIYFAK